MRSRTPAFLAFRVPPLYIGATVRFFVGGPYFTLTHRDATDKSSRSAPCTTLNRVVRSLSVPCQRLPARTSHLPTPGPYCRDPDAARQCGGLQARVRSEQSGTGLAAQNKVVDVLLVKAMELAWSNGRVCKPEGVLAW